MHSFFRVKDSQPNDYILRVQLEQMVKGKNGELFLQEAIWDLSKQEPLFYLTMVLHDWYHNVVQKINGFNGVIAIKVAFGERALLAMDVQADLDVFIFLNLQLSLDLEKYIQKVLIPANSIFANTNLHIPKIERFIGSIWSISHWLRTGRRTVYYPSLETFTRDSDTVSVLALDETAIMTIQSIDLCTESLDLLVEWWGGTDLPHSRVIKAIMKLCAPFPELEK